MDKQKVYQKLKERLSKLDRVHLALLPTPLQELPRLSSVFGGPRIFIKRDDLTGGACFSGNKTRMLEYRLAPAVRMKADILVSGFGVQSNHARQIAAAARKLGMDVRLILRLTPGDPIAEIQGNLLIDLLLGADITIVEVPPSEQAKMIHAEVEHLRKNGRRPYETGYHDEDLGAVAYVGCFLELLDQCQELGIRPSCLYVASEGPTQAGLLLANKLMGNPCTVIGVNTVDWVPDVRERIAEIAQKAAQLLGADTTVTEKDVVNYETEFRGPGYGIPTRECISAIRLLAETEAILLDQTYTGKAMAAMLRDIMDRKLGQGDCVVFLHTGGVPALFCHPEMFDFQI